MEKQYNKPKTQTARRSVSSRSRLSESEGDGVCVVCAHPVTIYAVGHCNHFICFKCSTKIRLLCEEDLCPVCRKELPKVIFSKKRDSYEALNTPKLIKDRDYDVGVFFADFAIIKEYRRILEHRCPVCHNRPPDKTFDQTKAHLRKEHTMFYCDICLEHNRTFTSECKVYNRKDLATHKRIGDPDDKSHRGHPLCEYCDVRFLDDDKLFHHLRTTHYYCHLCDEGESNEFYGTYPDLRVHFKAKHYLCEEGACINEEFTSVFGSQIDFKAHIASVHKDQRSKQQQKKDRQIDLGFQYARREPASSMRGRGAGRGSDRPRPQRNRPSDFVNYSNAFERESDLNRAAAMPKKENENSDKRAANKGEEMKKKTKPAEPVLSKEAPAAIAVVNQPTAFTRDDFPNLLAASGKSSEGKKKSDGKMIKSASGGNLLLWSKDPVSVTSKFQHNEDFPSLPSSQKVGISSGPKTTGGRNNKSAKKAKESQDIVMRPSSATAAKTILGKSKKNSQSFKSKDEDFPTLNSLNKVRAGRGSPQHFEVPRNVTGGVTSNVTVVSADSSDGKYKSNKQTSADNTSKNESATNHVGANASHESNKKQHFKSSVDDFPKLSSLGEVLGSSASKHFEGHGVLAGISLNSAVASTAVKDFSDGPEKAAAGLSVGDESRVSSVASNSSQEKNKKKSKNFKAKDEDFPSLSAVNDKIGRYPGWPLANASVSSGEFKDPGKGKSKSNKQIIASKDEKASSATTTTSKTNQGKSKKNTKTYKSTEEDFPSFSAVNEVLVGRGSFKHLEGHESFAAEPASNVAVITADFKNRSEGKSKQEKLLTSDFSASKDDFPSLLSHSKVSAPPGFNNVKPQPFLLAGGSLQSTFDQKHSNASASTKAPPGFHSKSVSSKTENNVFSANSFDFPSFLYPEQHPNGNFKTESLKLNNEITENNKKIAKTNNKKSKGFRSNNRNSDFPVLSNKVVQSDRFQPSSKAPLEPKSCNKPVPQMSKGLNLANIFD